MCVCVCVCIKLYIYVCVLYISFCCTVEIDTLSQLFFNKILKMKKNKKTKTNSDDIFQRNRKKIETLKP